MFGVGLGEIILIVVVVLLVFGPEKMPELAKQVGKGLRELRKASSDLQNSLHEAVYAEELKELREKYRTPQILPDPAAQPRDGARESVTPEALSAAIASAAKGPGTADPATGIALSPAAQGTPDASSAQQPATAAGAAAPGPASDGRVAGGDR